MYGRHNPTLLILSGLLLAACGITDPDTSPVDDGAPTVADVSAPADTPDGASDVATPETETTGGDAMADAQRIEDTGPPAPETSGGDGASDDGAGGDSAADATPPAACAPPEITSEVDGVSILLSETPCVFTVEQLAAGVVFSYTVQIDQAIEGVVPLSQDAGDCGQPDASGLVVFGRIDGGEELFCLCDVGLCAPSVPTPISLPPGDFPGAFPPGDGWSGHNWTGPSDFGNPPGDLFPPGGYTLTLSAKLETKAGPRVVKTTYGITLIP